MYFTKFSLLWVFIRRRKMVIRRKYSVIRLIIHFFLWLIQIVFRYCQQKQRGNPLKQIDMRDIGIELVTKSDGSILGLFMYDKFSGIGRSTAYALLGKNLKRIKTLKKDSHIIHELNDIGFVQIKMNEGIEI